MRSLFSDGANSFWHFVFGMLGSWYPSVVLLFFIYQVVKHSTISQSIPGILEFLVGYAVALSSEIKTPFASDLL
jgi:hypothetical protein